MAPTEVMSSSDAQAKIPRPQVGIDRLPDRRQGHEPKEVMNCKSCRKRKVRRALSHSGTEALMAYRSNAVGPDQVVKLARSSIQNVFTTLSQRREVQRQTCSKHWSNASMDSKNACRMKGDPNLRADPMLLLLPQCRSRKVKQKMVKARTQQYGPLPTEGHQKYMMDRISLFRLQQCGMLFDSVLSRFHPDLRQGTRANCIHGRSSGYFLFADPRKAILHSRRDSYTPATSRRTLASIFNQCYSCRFDQIRPAPVWRSKWCHAD